MLLIECKRDFYFIFPHVRRFIGLVSLLSWHALMFCTISDSNWTIFWLNTFEKLSIFRLQLVILGWRRVTFKSLSGISLSLFIPVCIFLWRSPSTPHAAEGLSVSHSTACVTTWQFYVLCQLIWANLSSSGWFCWIYWTLRTSIHWPIPFGSPHRHLLISQIGDMGGMVLSFYFLVLLYFFLPVCAPSCPFVSFSGLKPGFYDNIHLTFAVLRALVTFTILLCDLVIFEAGSLYEH